MTSMTMKLIVEDTDGSSDSSYRRLIRTNVHVLCHSLASDFELWGPENRGAVGAEGATENARHENAAQRKMKGWKMQERKIRHKKSWAGKCETSQYGKRTDAFYIT